MEHIKHKHFARKLLYMLEHVRTLNLIVAPCIFVESLQFIDQRMHI